MRFPELNSADDVEPMIEAVLADARVQYLREAFSPRYGLKRIVEHAESSVGGLNEAPERVQLQRIVARWTRLMDEQPVQPDDADALGALVTDASPWDLRVGAERDAIPTAVELFPRDVADVIMSLAHDWGMTSPRTAHGTFDVVMPIGGLLRANLARPAFAADLISSGVITTEMVIALASQRPTSLTEQGQADRRGAPADTEQAALAFGMERAFGFEPGDWSPTEDPGVQRAPDRDGVALFMGAAPVNTSHGRRATTGEAFAWLLSTSLLPPYSRILQITATHCWLANHVALLTTAPSGMRVRTVGSRITTEGPVRSQIYLQEIKAFADCLPVLRTWATRVPVAVT